MAITDKLLKSFGVSKMKVYFDGDPQEYIATVTFPNIVSPVETYDNTSTGGEVDLADPFRKKADGDGEIKIEATTQALMNKINDSSKVVNINLAMAVNNYNPQLGIFLPLPINYKAGVQFFDVDMGEIKQGQKIDITAKFKMFTWKVDVNLLNVVNYDFIAGSFVVDNADILTAVTGII